MRADSLRATKDSGFPARVLRNDWLVVLNFLEFYLGPLELRYIEVIEYICLAMKKQNARKAKTAGVSESDADWKDGAGSFTFCNDDSYEGAYKYHKGKLKLVREGYGTYKTDDFNEYIGMWKNDVYDDHQFHIRFNNGEEYRGKLDQNGMNGPGWYKFPDGSSIEAVWSRNRPIENIVYREQSGFPYFVEKVSENEITFAPTNYFWDELTAEETTNQSELEY